MASPIHNQELIQNSLNQTDLIQTANIYKLLSLLYSPPTEEFDEILTLLGQNLQSLKPDLIPLVSGMKSLSASTSMLQDLTIDHAKLFIGPFDLLAPPYGSIYLDGQRRIMGDSTMEVLQFYRQAGLNLSNKFKQPPDHIVTELEFMYYLTAQYVTTGNDQWLMKKEEFLNNYLSKWIMNFTDRIQESAKTTFYKNLACLTLELILEH
mgnify:CR=1 FL=1|jgi:TorA maturation chaperone TorD